MIKFFKTINNKVSEIKKAEKGSWIFVVNPTKEESKKISNKYNIDECNLQASLDKEERSCVVTKKDYIFIMLDTPTIDEEHYRQWYATVPLSIIITKDFIITICLKYAPIFKRFIDNIVNEIFINIKIKFVLQIIYNNADVFLTYLRIIDQRSDKIEEKLQNSTSNKEFIRLLKLKKSLVYFSISLHSNEVILEKLSRIKIINQYSDDIYSLRDIIIENKQAIEMVNIYNSVLSNMIDASASIISNNLNIVMKFFTAITIVVSVPSLIFGAYGMNLDLNNMPFTSNTHSFYNIVLWTIAATIVTIIILWKKNLF